MRHWRNLPGFITSATRKKTCKYQTAKIKQTQWWWLKMHASSENSEGTGFYWYKVFTKARVTRLQDLAFVREALQFPWILQQNLEAAARSGPKGSFSRCSGREKRRLQRLQCEKECEVEVVKSRFFFLSFFFFFFFFLEKKTFSANEDLFELCCIFFF